MPRSDVYISIDIEADGPIPGPFSMLSLGMAVAGTFDGQTFEPRDPAADTFYREFRPISDDYEAEALAVSGLDREALKSEGADPSVAMTCAAQWVKSASGRARPVAVAYP
jgi:hypothetical protein